MSRTAVVLPGTPVRADLSAWMDDRHAELFAAISTGDQVRTQRLTSMMAECAERLHQLTTARTSFVRRRPDSDSKSREGFESPRAGLFSQIGPTAESTVPASSGAIRRLVLVGAESHDAHAALAATVDDPPNSPQPNEPLAPAHDLESPSESDTESLGRDGLSQVAPEVLQEPGDAGIHDPEGIVQDHLIGEMRINAAFTRGLQSMDHVDLHVIFSLRACVLS